MGMSKRARRRLAILAVGAILVVGALAAAVQWRQASRAAADREAIARGLDLYEQERWAEALETLDSARARTLRTRADAMAALADSRRRVPMDNGRHLAAAVGYAQQALAVDPRHVPALELLLDVYTQTNQVTELLDVSERLLAIDATHREALWSRARGLAALRRTGADEAVAAMIEAHPNDVRGHGLYLQRMLSAGASLDEVREYADAQAEARPRSAEFLLLQAEARLRTGEPGEALEDLLVAAERVAEIEIDRPESLAQVVQLLDMLGQEQKASDLLARSLESGGDNAIASEAAAIAIERDWKSGRVEEARERALAATTDPDAASDAALGWSILLAEDGTPQNADHPHYDELLSRDSSAARFWNHLIDGRAALETGDWGGARGSLTSALMAAGAAGESSLGGGGTLAPVDIAEYLLGRVELALGSWRESVARLERVATRNPSWTGVRLELAALLLDNDKPLESFQQAARVLAREPGSYAAGKAAARAMVALLESPVPAVSGESDQAVALVQELRSAAEGMDDRELAEVLAIETRLRLVRGELDLAQRALERLTELEGAGLSPQTLASLLDRAEEAGLDGVAALESAAGDAPAIVERRARRLASLGRTVEAQALFAQAKERSHGARLAELQRREGLWLASMGEREGVEMLRNLAAENPRSASAQIDLLNAPGAWSQEALVQEAIDRLRSLGGETSLAWRIYEARRLLTFDPSDAKAAEAVELLGPGLRSASPDAAALALAGEAMAALEDRPAAADYYSRALDADPTRLALYPRLIALLQAEGRTELAEARLREFARRDVQDESLRRRRAALAESLGLWDLAAADRRALAEGGDDDPTSRARFAASLARTGQTREADAIIARLSDQRLSDPEAVSLTADYLAARDRLPEALDVIERSTLSPSERTILAARALSTRGRAGEALERVDAALAETPAASLHAMRARLLMAQGRLEPALESVRAGLALEPDSPELGVLEATLALRLGESDAASALDRLAKASETGTVDPVIADVIEATRELTANEDLGAYVERLEDAMRERPDSPLIARLLTTAKLQRGDVPGAVDTATALARVVPESAEAAQLATETLATAGRFDEAAAMARRWAAQSSDPAAATTALARIELAQGNSGDALARLEPLRERLLAEREAHPDRVAAYVRALAGEGRASEAREILEQLRAADPRWEELYVATSTALAAPPETVRSWLEEARQSDLEPGAQIRLADAWFQLAGRTGDAADFERVIALLDDLEGVERTAGVLLLAVALEQTGRHERAEQRYREALALIPGQPVALNNLAYLLARRGGSSEEPVELAQQAVAGAKELGMAASQLGTFHHTLGFALKSVDRDDEAVEAFREGLRYAPAHPSLLLSLAELLTSRGETDEASSLVRRIGDDPAPDTAAGRDPDFSERLEALRVRLGSADPDS